MKIFVAVLILLASWLPGMAQPESGWLGVDLEDVTQEQAAKLGANARAGVRVNNMVANGPAESAGVEPGDFVLSLDGAPMATRDGLIDAVMAKAPGSAVKLTVLRGGAERQLSVVLGKRPVQRSDSTPQLMLDTGGHMAFVTGLAVTADGRQLVSASNDKTVRVWDLASGRTVRTIRGEAAPGNWGVINAMALSPDGRWLAVAGYMSDADRVSASAIRLYDFASGTLVARLMGHSNIVLTLDFSADGKRLISGGYDKTAIIWDVAARRQLFKLAGHSEAVYEVAFNKAGTRAVSAGGDAALRLWNAANGRLIAEMTEHKTILQRELQREGKNPDHWSASVRSVAFSPDGRLIASGSEDGRVLFWDGLTGAFTRDFAHPGGMIGNSRIEALSFSPDGKWLLYASRMGGCTLLEVASGHEFRDGKLLEMGQHRDGSDRPRCNGPIAFTPDGRMAAAGYNSSINLIDPRSAKADLNLHGQGATVQAVGVSKDSGAVAWGLSTERAGEEDQKPLTRRLRLPLFGAVLAVTQNDHRPPAPAQDGEVPRFGTKSPMWGYLDLVRRTVTHGSWSVAFQSAGGYLINTRYLEISRDGAVQTKIDLGTGNNANSFTPMGFAPDGKTVLIGLGQRIVAYDMDGREVGAFTGHNGEVRDFVPSPDGRFLVSGAADQTVRLWNMESRELIASAFQGADGEWVVWTPQGYYASSPNGDRVVGWQINKGPDEAAEYVTASQLRHKFYRPDIVERAIVASSAAKAVEDSDQARTGSFELSDLTRRLPPKLGVVSPRGGSQTSNGRAVIELALAENADDPVKSFTAFVNDTKVTATAKREGGSVSIEVPLAQGQNRIRLVAQSKADLLAEATLDVVQRGEGPLDKRETLYIVAIGADKYPQLPKNCGPRGNASCDLAFAGADAKVFAATLEAQMGKQHRRVVKRVLVNGAGGALEPTRANIENVLDLLLQSRDTDTVAVFVAGHGIYDARAGYQFLPSDARYADGSNLAGSTVVKWSLLEAALQGAKGRRLLFVDTCRSTTAFNPRLMKDASDEAIVAFSATNTQQDALEMSDIGHGVFTNAVVKGLKGAADLAQEREVRVFDLGAYVEREVRKQTKGMQTPDFYKKPGAENFVLARLTDDVAALPPADRPKAVGAPRPARQEERPAAPPPQAAPPKAAAHKPDASPALTISSAEEAQRLESGQAALDLDDIAGARLIFEYLASRGSAAGAYQLAQTYDPQVQARAPHGALFKPDETLAQRWYQKAAELGHPDARRKLAGGN